MDSSLYFAFICLHKNDFFFRLTLYFNLFFSLLLWITSRFQPFSYFAWFSKSQKTNVMCYLQFIYLTAIITDIQGLIIIKIKARTLKIIHLPKITRKKTNKTCNRKTPNFLVDSNHRFASEWSWNITHKKVLSHFFVLVAMKHKCKNKHG